jgi:hypothetical protein
MTAFEELMQALRDEPEAVVLETLDAYAEREAERESRRDWLAEGEAERAIAEIMQR